MKNNGTLIGWVAVAGSLALTACLTWLTIYNCWAATAPSAQTEAYEVRCEIFFLAAVLFLALTGVLLSLRLAKVFKKRKSKAPTSGP